MEGECKNTALKLRFGSALEVRNDSVTSHRCSNRRSSPLSTFVVTDGVVEATGVAAHLATVTMYLQNSLITVHLVTPRIPAARSWECTALYHINYD